MQDFWPNFGVGTCSALSVYSALCSIISHVVLLLVEIFSFSHFFQALVLAFTSSFVSKLMYRLWHGGGSLNGFVHHTLSTAVVVDPSIHGNVTCQ